MDVVAWIVGLIVAAGFGMAGAAKVTGQQAMLDAADHLGFTNQRFQLIGAAEIAGAAGVVIGLISDDLEGLGIAAAVGLAIVGFGAGVFHRQAGDEPKDMAPALGLGVLAIVFIVAMIGR